MWVKDFLSKKRNIVMTYDLSDLKKRLTPLENVLVLHFLNKISSNNCQNGSENTVIVKIDLSILPRDEIFNLFAVYIENSILNYKKYEQEKINQFLFFLDWYVELYWEDSLKTTEHAYSLFKNRKII